MLQDTRQTALERAQAGDARALGELLDSFRPYLAAIARARRGRRLQGKVDDSDLIQDALLQAHRHFASFRGTTVAELAGWLRQIVVNATGHALRGQLDAAKRDAGREQTLAGLSDVVTNAGLKYLGENLPLRRLSLGDNGPAFTEVGLTHLWPQLEYLGLAGSWLSDAGLGLLPKLPKLVRMDLTRTQVTNAGVQRFAKQYPNLTTLRLHDNAHVTEAVLPTVASLKSLQELTLQKMAISDAGFKSLAAMKQLKLLELQETGLSAERIAALRTDCRAARLSRMSSE